MLDEFLDVQASHRGPGMCGWWDRLIPQLPEEKREALMQAARSPEISHRTISIVLERWGFEVSPNMVGHWRRTYVR